MTYNILIDVFVKQAKWNEAVLILDRLEHQARSIGGSLGVKGRKGGRKDSEEPLQ